VLFIVTLPGASPKLVSNILQLVFAFIYVLVVPGFAMSLAAFPRPNQLEITERLALSIGLSLTIVIAMGLLLGYSQTLVAATGGITAYSLIFGIGFVTAFFLVIWALRRANLAVAERREAARPERDMVLDAQTAKLVRPENSTQAQARPREAATPAAARRADDRRIRDESRPKRRA
jgi:uncharacterized membrane protein